MNLADVSIRRPVAIAMVVVGILLLGFVSLEKIPLNLLPDITYPKITVRTEYPNAAPREVEERVTKLIESSVGIINNVNKVSSVSRPGWSDVYVEFRWGSDVDVIAMDIREKIQLLENFLPDDVERPVLLRYDPNQDPILTLAVSGGKDLSDLRRWVEMNVELELERLDGVAAVRIEGGYEEEIVVELDEELLARYGLRMATIADRLERENLNVAGGSLEDGGSKLSVRTVNRFRSIEDISEVIIVEKESDSETGGGMSSLSSLGGGMSGMGGLGGMGSMAGLLSGLGGLSSGDGADSGQDKVTAVIRLKDIADVHYRPKERTEIARLDGRECIKVSIFKEGDANIVTVARDVKKAIEGIRQKHRKEPRSREWQLKLMSPGRKFKQAGNAILNLLLNYRPFVIEEEPVELEQNVGIAIISDQSVFIMQSIYSVAQTAIWGSFFAVFVLFVFLRNRASTLIVGMAIPVSIVTTFNLMYFRDISFNIMSLGGLALGVGMLVDNSIVVLENILRRRTFETDARISAQRGAAEVSSAITASTLTNIMVFFPILYLEGMFRQIFGDLAWTVAFALICSEVVALSIVPMLTVVFGKSVRLPDELLDEMDLPPEAQAALKRKRESGEDGGGEEDSGEGQAKEARGSLLRYKNFLDRRREKYLAPGATGGLRFKIGTPLSYMFFLPMLIAALVLKKMGGGAGGLFGLLLKYPLLAFDVGFNWLKRVYPKLLEKLLHQPGLTSIAAIAVAAASMSVIYILGWELLPAVDQGEFTVKIELPTGTPIEETNRRVGSVERKIRNVPDAEYITSLFTTVGIGTAEGEGASEKAENIGEVHVSMEPSDRRPMSDEIIIEQAMRSIEDEVSLVARSAKPQLLSYKTPVEIELEGSNLETLKEASDLVMKSIKPIDGLLEVESSMEEENPEINITIDRTRASALGLSVSEITEIVRTKVKGETPTRFDLPEEQIDIVVELEEQDRATFDRLKRLTIPAPGGDIRLEQVARIRTALGPAAITRAENSRVALIGANIHGRPLGDVVGEIEEALGNLAMPGSITWRITGQNEEMQRSLPSLYLAVTLAIALVYIVLAAQFESLVHPFVIMFCVPFSLVGLAIILPLTGQTINIFSLIGMLMMVGIAVNDAIVFVSTINIRRDEGMERTAAIVEAGRSRLRPIMITTLTTALGMFPMALALGPGSELRAPMAITVIGGIASSTFFTLTAIPCIYLVLDRMLPRSYKVKPAESGTASSMAVTPAESSGGAGDKSGDKSGAKGDDQGLPAKSGGQDDAQGGGEPGGGPKA